jgi:hypothetical protein
VRLDVANGYDGSPGLLASLVLGPQRTPDRLRDRPGHPARAETFRRLAALTGASIADVYAATTHRFAPTLTPPEQTAPTLMLPEGVVVPLLGMGSMQKRLRPPDAGAFCPRCLVEAAYHRLIWTPQAVAACLRHRCLLVDRCQRCGGAVAVSAIAVATCASCGADLTTCSAASVDADRFGLFAQRVVQDWLLGKPPPPDPCFPLPDLPITVAYRAVDGLRLLAHGAGPRWSCLHQPWTETGPETTGPSSGFALTPEQAYALYATALKALLRWPWGFYDFLDAYSEREPSTDPPAVGLAPRLGSLYSAWLGYRWRHESFGFLHDAFDRYLLDRYGRVHAISQLSRCRRDPDLIARLPYPNLRQAARLIGTTVAMVKRLLQGGHLTPYAAVASGRARPPTLLSRAEVLAWREAWSDQPTLVEAAAILGVSYWVVTDLIACGFLPPPHQFADDRPGWRFNRAAIVAAHARVAAQVRPLPTPATAEAPAYLTLAGAAQTLGVLGLNAAALLVQVAEGRLPAYHPATAPVRLGDLRFAPADVQAYAARVKAEHDWLDRVETARRLGVTELALQRLVTRGLLRPVPINSHAQFFGRGAVERFRDEHVTSQEAAALLGVGPDVIQRWTRRGRLTAVSGPGVDDAHAYLFERSVLAQWRAERLPFGEAVTLLGVAKSTLARWAATGRIVPLADMGGKQRWFARQDLLRLRDEYLAGVRRPRSETTHRSAGLAGAT